MKNIIRPFAQAYMLEVLRYSGYLDLAEVVMPAMRSYVLDTVRIPERYIIISISDGAGIATHGTHYRI